jgi:uncharacterized protein involved in propanediol utilization
LEGVIILISFPVQGISSYQKLKFQKAKLKDEYTKKKEKENKSKVVSKFLVNILIHNKVMRK